MLVCAALVALVHGTGCSARRDAVAEAPPTQWVRDARMDPWSWIGTSPDARWIAHALREAGFYGTFDECPLQFLDCGRRLIAGEAMVVTDIRCVAVDPVTDRCSFRLTETRPGAAGERARSVRSRCTGHFWPLGTSHSPPEWGLKSWQVPPPVCTPDR
ncbi:MAG TPA: hypothetical protein VF006_16315 [Longimicrobium sp.]